MIPRRIKKTEHPIALDGTKIRVATDKPKCAIPVMDAKGDRYEISVVFPGYSERAFPVTYSRDFREAVEKYEQVQRAIIAGRYVVHLDPVAGVNIDIMV